MGEEWGSSSPFQFFSSHPEPKMARATAQGRKREFAEHGWDADEIPDQPDLADPWLDRLRIDYDEARRWIAMHRGALASACNLGADAVAVPANGEVVLAWGEPTVDAKTTRLEGHSFAVVKSPSTATPPVDN